MTFDHIRRRLDRIERRTTNSGPGHLPAIRVITESDEDRDRQLTALHAAGRCRPDQLVIDRRIIDPYPEERRP